MPKEPSKFAVKYGYRAVVPLAIILIFAFYLLVEYLVTGMNNNFVLAFSIVFFLIAILLFVGFTITISNRITKKYFHTETVVGQTGRVLKGVPANQIGTVVVMSEDWSFICDTDTYDNELVTVIGIQEDTATLRIKKIS
ncbi:MAG: NfeD family protein [Thermoplasmatales archaeon]|jgi:membrane protein implicated in regulation of membrane protease activity|nr:NfeD family protein [Candidatus Thermoplasmatota archaeon]MCL6002827.1 NfeD family protein [Candidatus Thermoplasmatota archaeon]MDA8054311.1 NfeD family protein [Thermoplasmatales archaeon]